MADDDYTELLGLPPGRRPPHYYDLLGLALFEAGTDEIRSAVLQQTAKLKRLSLHPDPDRARRVQELLKEVNWAGTLLQDPEKKRQYDASLAVELGLDVPELADAVAPAAAKAPPPGRTRLWIAAGSVGLVLVLGVVLLAILGGRGEPVRPVQNALAPVEPPKPLAPAERAKEQQEDAARALAVAVRDELDLGGGVTMKMALVPAGEFKKVPRLKPKRTLTIRITKSFYMGACEVTQEQYEWVMGRLPLRLAKPGDGGRDRGEKFRNPKRPVVFATAYEAYEFCRKLSARTGRSVRLPTEAEWELACRAGTSTPFNTGETISTDQANFVGGGGGVNRKEATPVGTFAPNTWGLYDMHGNVAEYCLDGFAENRYEDVVLVEHKSSLTDPVYGKGDSSLTVRGGHWDMGASNCASESRRIAVASYRKEYFGFRIVCEVGPGKETALPATALPADEAQKRQREEAYLLRVPAARDVHIGGGNRVKLAFIPPGEFMMGAPPGEEGRYCTEYPQHKVRITKPFYMGVTEVTQLQYKLVMDKLSDRTLSLNDHPIEDVSHDDAREFCQKMSAQTGLTVRLPTEAEWEYACRAGTTTPFHTGETISTDQANYNGNYAYGEGKKGLHRGKSERVGTDPARRVPANAWGLHDMHGNVSEWCSDTWDACYYEHSPADDPVGPGQGRVPYVVRGGSWRDSPGASRSASRGAAARDDFRSRGIGFRVALDIPDKNKETGKKPDEGPEEPTVTVPAFRPPAPAEAAPTRPEEKPSVFTVVVRTSVELRRWTDVGQGELGRPVAGAGGKLDCSASLTEQAASSADVILIWHDVKLGAAEARLILDFVKAGGGLVCAVTPPFSRSKSEELKAKEARERSAMKMAPAWRRPSSQKTEDPTKELVGLLNTFGVTHHDIVRWNQRPKGYSQSRYIRAVVERHPVTQGVKVVWFEGNLSVLALRGIRATPVLTTPKGCTLHGRLAVAGPWGKGRVVVIGGLPYLGEISSDTESVYNANDGPLLMLNALLWAAGKDELIKK